jgi:hypothetical protein
MEKHTPSVADLPLSSVVEVWGIERVQDILASVQGGAIYVAVQDGAGKARVLSGALVEQADSEMILDMIRGGRTALYVDGATPVDKLPSHRPLLIRKGEKLLGLLDDGSWIAPKSPRPKRWVGEGGADAQAAAMRAVKSARDTFRHRGVALILDIQPSRVIGDPRLVQDVVDHLLEGALDMIDRNGGGTGVHVTVTQGQSGLWIGVEDSGSHSHSIDPEDVLSDSETHDLAILAIRRMHKNVVEAGGQMRVIPTRTGTRFMVCLPAP